MAVTQTRAPVTTGRPRPRLRWGSLADTLASLLVVVFVLLPIVWLVLTSFKGQRDAFSLNVFFEPTLANFRIIFSDTYRAGDMLITSFAI